MAWSWGRKGGGSRQSFSSEQPTNKKRKVEETSGDVEQKESVRKNEDDWDADEDFTQDELEALDLIASQAINQSHAPTQTAEPHTDVSFVVPVGTAHSAANRSTSSSSDNSILPRSLSSRSNFDTSNSLSSSSSSNGKLDPSGELAQTLQKKLEEERKQAKEEKYHYDGEVKSLKERLHRQEGELERLRTVRDEHDDQQRRVQTEKMLKLQSQLDSLTSQVQFMERECQNLQEKNTSLQQKMRRLELQNQTGGQRNLPLSQMPASPRKVSVQRSPVSKHKLQEMKEAASTDQTGFPTTQSFMEQAVHTSNSTKPAFSSVSIQTTGISYATKPPQNRRLHAHTGLCNAFGKITGSQIVQHLLQVSASEGTFESKNAIGKSQWEPGLVDLLHGMSTSLKISDLRYGRDKDSSCLSPLRPMRSPVVSSSDGTAQVVTRHNLHLAIEGLSLLLDEVKNIKDDKNGQDTERNVTKNIMKIQTGTTSTSSGIAGCESDNLSRTLDMNKKLESTKRVVGVSKRGQNTCSYHSGATMLLPLLKDYIHHYHDLTQATSRSDGLFTPAQASVTSPQSLDTLRKESSSSDFGFESLSCQLSQLLHEGRIYASSGEMYAVTALRCLVLLIQLRQEVVDFIIANHTSLTVSSKTSFANSSTSSSSNLGTVTEQQSKKSSSSVEADDEQSSSSEIRIIVQPPNSTQNAPSNNFVNNKATSSLLNLIIRLASQDLEDGQSSPEVVKLAVRALAHLCQCCKGEDLPKLEIVITPRILAGCFKQTKYIPVLIWAQRLLVSLAKSEKLLTILCTKSDNCPLFLMHRSCFVKDGTFDLSKEYILTLSSLISAQRSGMRLLLSNACPCTEELVTAVIMCLYNLLPTYKTTEEAQHKQEVLNILAQGVILIHSLSQGDAAFNQHHMPVQLQYSSLLSGLASIMKSDKQTWELQLSALEDLCDFDIYDSSQESEGEDKMDNS